MSWYSNEKPEKKDKKKEKPDDFVKVNKGLN